MDDVHQVVIVAGIQLDEHIISTRGDIALGDLRDFLQFFHHIVKCRWIFQIKTDISTSLVADLFRIDDEL